MLQQLAEVDPDFNYTDYVDGNCTLQEVISIRQCFLELRLNHDENGGDVVLCGGSDYAADPPETIQARKLRTIPFLTNEDII